MIDLGEQQLAGPDTTLCARGIRLWSGGSGEVNGDGSQMSVGG